MVFQQTESEHFQQNLIENFGLHAQDLVRANASSAKFKISSLDKIAVSISKKIKTRYRLPSVDYELRRDSSDLLSIWPAHMFDKKTENDRRGFDKSVHDYTKHVISHIPSKPVHGTIALLSLIMHIIHLPGVYFPNRSFYFPAARSGIMHAYKPILSSAIRSYKHKKSPSTHPETTGVVSDLLSSLVNIGDENTTDIAKIGRRLEAKLFDGTIFLRDAMFGTPEIYYKFMDKDLPIHISSSSIAENAPLSIFLRHVVKPHDILIIEEPEAHLHPYNQLILARHLVHLIRKGVRVFVTTHSVFFLEKISMFVKLGSLTEKQRMSKNYGKYDYLLDREVAPYVFKKKSVGNHIIEEVPHSATEGISQEEFVNISIDMYNEDTLLNDTIGNNSNGDN